MEQDLKNLIEDNLELSKQNHKMLKKLLSYRRLEALYSIVKWVIVIGFALYSFYYLQPYLEQLLEVYENVSGVVDTFPKFGN